MVKCSALAGFRREGPRTLSCKFLSGGRIPRAVSWSIRPVGPGRYTVGDVFAGLEESLTLRKMYPEAERRSRTVRETPLVVSTDDMYGYVDDADGTIYFGHAHLTKGDPQVVYLDILHELVHVKQLGDGADLYDKRYAYVDRPTEVEAYALVVEEARRLGMTESAIADYLFVEWASPKDHERLCRRLGVNGPGPR